MQEAGADATAAADVVALTTAADDALGVAELELVTLATTADEVATFAEEVVTFATDELVTIATEVLAALTEVCSVVATLRQLQALLNFLGFIEQYVANAGRPLVAVEEAVVYVAQKAAAEPDEAVNADAQASLAALSHARIAGTNAPRKKRVERMLMMPSIQ